MWGEGAPPAHRSLLPSLASPHTGYLLALGPLLFISICDVWLQLFSRDQAYAINLAAVGTVAFGCTGRTRGGRGLSVCRGRVIQGEPGSGLVRVHMHTGMSTFTHHTLHTHRAACAGHALSEHMSRTHVHTPRSLMRTLRHRPGFLGHKLCFPNSQAHISMSVFLLGSSFPVFLKRAFYFETISHLSKVSRII